MSSKIIHSRYLCEYLLPLAAVPNEVENSWLNWTGALVRQEPRKCRDLLRARFSREFAELNCLAELVMEHETKSLFVADGVPFLRLSNRFDEDRFISVPPEMSVQSVCRALDPYGLDDNRLLVEFLVAFGGICEQRPSNEVRFSGRRSFGNITIDPASSDFEAGLEYLSDAEIRERRCVFARWSGGVQVIKGKDGEYWHIANDGSVCWHECGMSEIGGVFDSLADLIRGIVDASSPDFLFKGVYDGVLPGMHD